MYGKVWKIPRGHLEVVVVLSSFVLCHHIGPSVPHILYDIGTGLTLDAFSEATITFYLDLGPALTVNPSLAGLVLYPGIKPGPQN